MANGVEQEEKKDSRPTFFGIPLTGKQNLFSSLGKTLQATSLGLKGQDYSHIFAERPQENVLGDTLDRAQALAMIGEGDAARALIRASLGLPAEETAVEAQATQDLPVIRAPRASQDQQQGIAQTPLMTPATDFEAVPSGITQSQKTLEGTKTTRFDVERPPEQAGRREGIEKSVTAGFKEGSKLSGAIKAINEIRKQFDEAVPSEGRSPLLQRVNGMLSVFGAKTGILPNDELLALKKNSRPQAIQLIRKFGEVGALSETEQKSAIDIVEMEGLTENERAAQVKQFFESSMAGMDQDVRDFLIGQDDIRGILQGLGVDIAEFSGKPSQKVNIEDIFKGVVIDAQ